MNVIKVESNTFDCELTPSELHDLNAGNTVIPEKSRDKYLRTYDVFKKWQQENDCKLFSESVFLAYFNEKSNVWKPSSMWAHYSMLRSTMFLNHHIDLKDYKDLNAYLKIAAKGFKSKKATMFTMEEIKKFLSEAPDEQYLASKVIAIFGVSGACSSGELVDILQKHVTLKDDIYLVEICESKNNAVQRSFTITGELVKYVKKYAVLRPSSVATGRFFLNYQQGKCTVQPIGINKFRRNAQKIAEYLQLANPESYNGHSYRRIPVTVLANPGVDATPPKRLGEWESVILPEGHVNEQMLDENNDGEKKVVIKTAEPIDDSVMPKRIKIDPDSFVDTPSGPQIQLQNLTSQEIHIPHHSGISVQMTNCTNCIIKFEK